MDLSKLPIFAMATKRMDWLTRRQEVLAQNIANADTPKFVPHDMKAQDFARLVKPEAPKLSLAATDAHHLPPTRAPRGANGDVATKNTYETAPTGNSVVLEEQLMKVAETQSSYKLASSLYAKHLSLIKTAIGRNGGG
ncbi:MAG: flagellar basal body protein [Rhodospirillales bacterium]